MTDLITLNREGSVAVLTMNSAENRHNPDFVAAFNRHLDTIEDDTRVGAVVLTSASDKNWSLGIDLQWMSAPDTDAAANAQFMNDVTGLFKRLINYPLPIIAALNGHTFGNGSVLACACDFRFMKSDKGFFCFPEVDVLVPFFPSMLPLIQKAIPLQYFNRLAMIGERVGAQQLLDNNVIKALFKDSEDLHQGVMAFASQFNKNRWIYGQNKSEMNKGITRVMEQEDPAFIAKMSVMLTQMMQKKK